MSFLTHIWRATCPLHQDLALPTLEREARYIFATCTRAHADQHSAGHSAILSDMSGMHASTARAAATPLPHPQAPAPTPTHQLDVVCGQGSKDEPQHVSDGEVFV